MSDTSVDTNGMPKHKKDFIDFHNANGVRTVMGSIGPVKDGECRSAMLSN